MGSETQQKKAFSIDAASREVCGPKLQRATHAAVFFREAPAYSSQTTAGWFLKECHTKAGMGQNLLFSTLKMSVSTTYQSVVKRNAFVILIFHKHEHQTSFRPVQ